jgi:hypothetical protein
MDFFEFAKQVAMLEQLLRAEDRRYVNIKLQDGAWVTGIALEDDGTGNDNLDGIITFTRRTPRDEA